METQQEEKEFNLLYEPWILVKTRQNAIKEWSLLDVFQHAHEAQQLAGELPTQDMAIMRLLLAIMHGAFVTSDVEDADDAKELWKELWEMKRFPYGIIERYLKQYEERFWLFHPEYPFYQVADIEKSTEYPAKKLIGSVSESTNKIRLFSERADIEKNQITYAESARWLLYVNAFDDTSSKPVKKGLGSPGTGWLGKLGLVYAQGNNLFETLFLNFVLIDNRNELFADNDRVSKAYWEIKNASYAERVYIAQPRAQKTLLTLQSRRLQLKRDGGAVVGFKLLGGDYFDKDNALKEQMTLWRKDPKGDAYVPKRHQSNRQIWRDFSALLVEDTEEYEPGIVHWLKYLKQNNLYENKCVKFGVTAVEYGDKDFFVTEIINDSIQMNSALLRNLGKQWISRIVQLLSNTDKAVASLGWLAVNIATAQGKSIDDDKNKKQINSNAREIGYHQLDKAFRKWLLSIDPQQDNIEDKMPEWMEMAKKIILNEGAKIIEKCSDKALVGYIKKDKNINAFVYYNKFRVDVYKILGQEG